MKNYKISRNILIHLQNLKRFWYRIHCSSAQSLLHIALPSAIFNPMHSPFYTPNYSYNGFRVVKSLPLKELKAHLVELEHDASGAKVLWIHNDDSENVFSLSFQTLPNSSNGVAHILEHTVLCGSKKYPVKDPFFAMSRRSLNTFMNALTGSDFTCYPAASQNEKDFYNLLDVYLDAVFHPELKELSFSQEGHRLEFETPQDSSTPLVYRGVVYNEMKGAMNSGSARMHEELYNALFPDNTYGVNSGGDPGTIPSLTYEELLQFHREYYHPSRCLFFFYGSLPLEKHLDFIAEHTLNAVQKVPPLPPIDKQKPFKEAKEFHRTYPISSDENPAGKTLISFGWVTCLAEDQETCLALDILEAVLLDTDASPLKKALLQTRLCKQVSSYLDTEVHQVPFVINLKGCEPTHSKQLEVALLKTLQEIADKGIQPQAIENAIHQEEFHRSEITGDHYPFGLSLFMRSALIKQHGGSSENGLLIHTLFDALREKIKQDPRYFSKLIEKYLLQNPHRVMVVLTPDDQMEKKELEEERRRLDAIESRLDAEERTKLIEQANRLRIFQAQQERADIDLLPKVTLEDASKKAREIALTEEALGGLNLHHHNCFTNEICYADLLFSLPAIDKADLPYVRLLSVILPQIGTRQRNYENLLESFQEHTGGISTYLTLQVQAENPHHYFPAIALRGKSLYRKMDKLFPLMTELASEALFSDHDRLKEVLQKHLSSLESNFNQNAIRYSTSLSSSCLSAPNVVSEAWWGLHYLHSMREIVKSNQIEALVEKLTSLYQRLFTNGRPDLVLSIDQKAYDQLKAEEFYGLSSLQSREKTAWSGNYPLPHVSNQARLISSPVAFISKVFRTIPYIHPDAPALRAASHLLENVVLHKKIREEGGAYGGGAVSNGASGNFYFYSFRDPHIDATIKAFEDSITTISTQKFDAEDLEEAKFEMIQDLDAPISPGHRAETAYHWNRSGKTLAVRQAFRDRLLSLTPEQVAKACSLHIKENYPSGKTVVFAGKALVERENKKLDPPLEIITG